MRIARKAISLLLLWIIVIGAPLVSRSTEPASTPELREVAFIPQWQPQAQFAGFYVALEKGIYRRHGLAVTILRGGPDRPSAEWLRTGAATFGTLFLSTAILQRSKGTPLVNLAQLVQKSSQLLLAKRSSGIERLEQMDGKKVGLWGAELSVLPSALFRKIGIHPVVVRQSSTINLFLRGGVDVVSAMWYNEYHTILNAGMDANELTVFRLSDSINFPEDGIYGLEETVRNDPETCCRFVRASLEGWRYAFDHREEALDIVMNYVNEAQVATNRVHQRWMLDCMRDLFEPSRPGDPRGALAESDYLSVASALQASSLIDTIPPFTDFRMDCAGSHEK